MEVLTGRRWIRILSVLSVTLIITILISISIGPSDIKIRHILLDIILTRSQRGSIINEPFSTILFQVRLPRILLAGVVGSSLAAAGVALQALLRNPLAEPYILGVSGGAAFGAVLSIALGLNVTFWNFSVLPIFAFLGAMFSTLLIYQISKVHGKVLTHALLLSGVILNAIFSALIMFITSISNSSELHNIVFWLMGNIGPISYINLAIVSFYTLIGIGILLSLARNFNLLTLGEEPAQFLGAEIEKTKKITFLSASLITGSGVSLTGLIGFVGLIVPHATRMIVGSDHRILIPAAVLLGAIFLILADTVARTVIAPTEIPVGVVTALCGGPLFIWLLKRQSKFFPG